MSNYIYRKIWTEHYGPIPKDQDGRSYEIHHKDGDNANNDIMNLQCVSIQEHFDIHHQQNDQLACFIMGVRMKLLPTQISELASLANKRRVDDGTHHWLDGQISKKTQNKRIKNGTHHFLGPNVNKKRVENGTHNWSNGDVQRRNNEKLLNNGTHPFILIHTCPKCGKIGKGTMMFRWHFDNCKY